MLRRYLSRKDCNLVRLGIAGTAVGDEGIIQIGKALQVSFTCIYEMIRSLNTHNNYYRKIKL